MQAFVVSLRERGVKPRWVNTYLQCMNAFGMWLHQEHGHERVRLPLLKVERRVLVTLTEAQIRQLLSFRPRTFHEWRVHALVAAVLDTGCRIDELLRLSAANVDLDNLLLTVRGKGDRERKVPVSFELRKILFRYLQQRAARGMPGDLVFGSGSGTAWNQRNSLRALYLLQGKLGLPKFGWHRLRHTMATQYLKAGGEVVRLSKVLGHSQLTTTMKYEHLLTEDIQAPHQRLSVLQRLR
jgi:integrase/recombinase XerD